MARNERRSRGKNDGKKGEKFAHCSSWPRCLFRSTEPHRKKRPPAKQALFGFVLTFVPAMIFWLILAAMLVARLSLAETQ